MRAESFRALSHQRIPFERLVALARAEGRKSLVNVAFGLQNMPAAKLETVRWREPVLLPTGTAKFDFQLLFELGPNTVTGTLEYDLTCYDSVVSSRFAESYVELLSAAVSDPAARLSALPLSPSRPSALPGCVLRGPSCDLAPLAPPNGTSLLGRVSAQLARDPDAPAVTCENVTVTRSELRRWVTAVARRLLGRDVGAGTIIGVLTRRGGALVAAWLGTLHTGAAFMPLDLETPLERLRFMLHEVGCRILLADDAGSAMVRALGAELEVIDVTALRRDGEEWTPPSLTLDGSETAVVIYTSGSTGRPKSVLVPHRGLANTALWWAADASLGHRDRLLCAVGTAFDPATFETFRALAAGSELVFASDHERRDARMMLKLLHRATVASMTPSLLRAILDCDFQNPEPKPEASTLRLLYLGGEQIPSSLVRDWSRRYRTPLRNVYGPTEASCVSTAAAVVGEDARPPSIGTPIWNTRAYVLGADGEELPRGARGELYIAGPGVAAGYFAQPELTKSFFLPDPFASADEPGARMYRTRDRAAIRRDGALEYLGRSDDQVKILGTRIELGEVARSLERHGWVKAASVVARGEPPQLVAYVVLGASAGPVAPSGLPSVTRDELIRPLLGWLSVAMIPSLIYVVERLPLTANDKLDLAALHQMPMALLDAGSARSMALTPEQRWAAEHFRQALRHGGRWQETALAPDSDFFVLGGHSLLVTRMLAHVELESKTVIRLPDFLAEPTIAGLARLRQEAIEGPSERAAPDVRSALDARHPATHSQERLAFLNRVSTLRSAYLSPCVLELTGSIDRAALLRALKDVLTRHPALRSRFELDIGARQLFYRTDGPPPPIAELDASAWTEQQLSVHLDAFCWTPFDLQRDAPARAEVVAQGQRTWLLLVVHHIVSDGRSHQVLLEQLGTAYRGELTGLTVRLPDAVHPAELGDPWKALPSSQRAALAEKLLTRLRGAPTDIGLRRARPRQRLQSTAAAVAVAALDAHVSLELRATIARLGCTMSMAAAALLAVALARTCGQLEYVFAFPWAGRDTMRAMHAVGLLMRTLVLRVNLAGAANWQELLARVREESLISYGCQDVPFETVAAELDPGRDLSRPPVTPVLMTVVERDFTFLDLGAEAAVREIPLPNLRIKYELEFTLKDAPDGIELAVAYSSALFDSETIERLLETMVLGCHELNSSPDAAPLPPLAKYPRQLPTASRCMFNRARVQRE